jgi:type VI protein secretion system component VasF
VTLKQPGSVVVRPNTLRDQMASNTFSLRIAPGNRASTSGASSAAAPKPVTKRRLPVWVLAAAIALVLILAVYLLNPTP